MVLQPTRFSSENGLACHCERPQGAKQSPSPARRLLRSARNDIFIIGGVPKAREHSCLEVGVALAATTWWAALSVMSLVVIESYQQTYPDSELAELATVAPYDGAFHP